MPKISIYIPERELKRIDEYIQNNKYKRGTFLWKSAISVINKVTGEKEAVKCDYCRSGSVGQFRVKAYNWEEGETEVIKNLCKLHLEQAQKEGEAKQVG